MAYRFFKGSDPFFYKTTRNERFSQMSQQEKLIEQKKREIQAKLEEQKKKETEEALKKLQGSVSSKSNSSAKSSSSQSGQKGSRKTFWKSNQDIKWKKDLSREDNQSSVKRSVSINIFSNDGSFLDNFKKLSGPKDGSKGSVNHNGNDEQSATGNLGLEEDESVKHTEIIRRRLDDSEKDPRKNDYLREGKSSQDLNLPHSQTTNQDKWKRQDDSPTCPVQRSSSPYSPTRATSDTPNSIQEETPQIGSVSSTQFDTSVIPSPVIPSVSFITTPSQSQRSTASFIAFAPPPLHTIPPPNPITSIPPPLIQQHVPPPTRLSIPPPSPLLQQSIPPPMPAAHTTLPPPILQTPPPLVNPSVPPPSLIPQQALPPIRLTNSVQTSAPLSVIQTAVPPPPIVTPIIPSLLSHPVQPPTSLPVHLPVNQSAPGLICPSTAVSGVSPVQGAVEPSAEEATNDLARMVAQCGDDIEEIIKTRNPNDHNLWFLHDKSSTAYIQYRCLVQKFKVEYEKDKKDSEKNCEIENVKGELKLVCDDPSNRTENIQLKHELTDEDNSRHSDGIKSADESEDTCGRKRKKRRSRWAPETEKVDVGAVGVVTGLSNTGVPPIMSAGSGTMLTQVNRNNPGLLQYAKQAFGTLNLSEDDWKKAEDHYKINLLYQDMMRKRQELEKLQRAGKFKYEYDSDEETEGGTWEHKLRQAEMEATRLWAEELNAKAEGKHHIGDFLPPDELERFLEKYSALKEGREPDLSDYKEFKLKEDNIGFQMLQKLGWSEGQGLGADGLGITDPVNKASTRPDNQGLGVERPEDVSKGDDEYDAYRKRMMLAYRFRPNPLNNPRRPYY